MSAPFNPAQVATTVADAFQNDDPKGVIIQTRYGNGVLEVDEMWISPDDKMLRISVRIPEGWELVKLQPAKRTERLILTLFSVKPPASFGHYGSKNICGYQIGFQSPFRCKACPSRKILVSGEAGVGQVLLCPQLPECRLASTLRKSARNGPTYIDILKKSGGIVVSLAAPKARKTPSSFWNRSRP